MTEHAGAEERATRCVSWWIAGNYDDGEATCRRWEAMTAEQYDAMVEAIDEEETPSDEAKDDAVYSLSAALKDWCEEERGDVSGTAFDDMLGYMMACVDWDQLARDAIEQREIEAAR